LFAAETASKPPHKRRLARTFRGCTADASPEAARESPAVRQPTTRFPPSPRPRPSEPILFPKLRILLPTSLTYIVLSTRGCSPWRPDADMGTTGRRCTPSPGFSSPDRSGAPDAARTCGALRGKTLSPTDPVPGPRPLNQKRQLFPAPADDSPDSVLALRRGDERRNDSPCPGSGMINPIPFRLTPRRAPLLSAFDFASIVRPLLGAAFACGLGSTNPCASAVHMEPFSTSVLQSSHLNICYYHQDLHRRPLHPGSRPTPSTLTATPSYSSGYGPLRGPICPDGRVWAGR
jgi:hypothetical protein